MTPAQLIWKVFEIDGKATLTMLASRGVMNAPNVVTNRTRCRYRATVSKVIKLHHKK